MVLCWRQTVRKDAFEVSDWPQPRPSWLFPLTCLIRWAWCAPQAPSESIIELARHVCWPLAFNTLLGFQEDYTHSDVAPAHWGSQAHDLLLPPHVGIHLSCWNPRRILSASPQWTLCDCESAALFSVAQSLVSLADWSHTWGMGFSKPYFT